MATFARLKDRTRTLWRWLKSKRDQLRDDTRAVTTAVFWSALVTGGVIVARNKAGMDWLTDEVIFFIFVLLYASILAVVSRAQVKSERDKRDLEYSFHYDGGGALYNGTQVNIALRISTLKALLGAISKNSGDDVKEAMRQAGKSAAASFAPDLASIYNDNVQRRHGGKLFEEMYFREKLKSWSDYDTRTGWGSIHQELKSNQLTLHITHYKGLFDDMEGEAFAEFLAVYCEQIVTELLQSDSEGDYATYTSAEIEDVNTKKGDKAEIVLNFR